MALQEEWMLLRSLKTLYDQQSEVDLALLTQDQEVILCHSLVGAANSDYIQQCSTSYAHDKRPVTDSNAKYCIQVNYVKKSQLSRFVDYFYTGEIEITTDDVTNLLLAATILDVKFIKQKVHEFIGRLLWLEKHETILQFYKTNNYRREVESICYEFMFEKFPEVLESNDISTLDVDLLLDILTDVVWFLDSQGRKLETIVQWLQSQPPMSITTETCQNTQEHYMQV